MIIILIDTREQNGSYIQRRFESAGIESEIITFPKETGTDYLIAGDKGTCAVQRKVVCSEFVNEIDEILYEIAPALLAYSDNPSFLIEENFEITKDGYLQNRNDHRPTDMLATSYYGILETLRKKGLDVYCTRDLNASIWWMVAMHGYLSKHHYPKHRKYFSVQERAVGMLTVIPGLGETRANKALTLGNIAGMGEQKIIPGLSEIQSKKLNEVLKWKNH